MVCFARDHTHSADMQRLGFSLREDDARLLASLMTMPNISATGIWVAAIRRGQYHIIAAYRHAGWIL
jgi:hypothetical protein